MRRAFLHPALFGCLLAMLVLGCSAQGKETATYDITSAWFDDETIYLRYRYDYSRLPLFSFEIRATPVETKTAFFILTLPRARVAAESAVVRLIGGDQAETIEYKDHDLQVEWRGSLLVVKGRQTETELDDCNWQYWRNAGLARINEGLFVCGAFADRTGHVVWRLASESILRLGERLAEVNQRGPNAVAKAAPVLATTFEDGKLRVTTDWTAVRPERVLIATFEQSSLAEPVLRPSAMAAASGYFGLQSGRRVYSPNGAFVVDNGTKNAPALAVCDAAACTPLPLPGRPAYLLVDHPRRVVYYLGQLNTKSIEVEVRHIAY